jgi:hypothetical protein
MPAQYRATAANNAALPADAIVSLRVQPSFQDAEALILDEFTTDEITALSAAAGDFDIVANGFIPRVRDVFTDGEVTGQERLIAADTWESFGGE